MANENKQNKQLPDKVKKSKVVLKNTKREILVRVVPLPQSVDKSESEESIITPDSVATPSKVTASKKKTRSKIVETATDNAEENVVKIPKESKRLKTTSKNTKSSKKKNTDISDDNDGFDETEEVEELGDVVAGIEVENAEVAPKKTRGRKKKASVEVTGGTSKSSASDGRSEVSNPGARSDAIKGYMDNIVQYSLITRKEEVELAAQIHGDDEMMHDTARETLINANLRLVVKIAHDFKGLGLPLTDLISEGNIGLMRAVEKFNPAKGAKFSSYAAWWIKQSMRRALANQSRTIRIPVQSASKINKIKSARMALMEKLGREPTDAEIASHLDFSQRTVAGLRMAAPQTISLHDPIQQGEDGEFQDIIPDRRAVMPDQIIADLESRKRLRTLINELDDREKRILQMRFGLGNTTPKTLEDVSQEIGRTRERVRQIQNQALSKLKTWLADEAEYAAD